MAIHCWRQGITGEYACRTSFAASATALSLLLIGKCRFSATSAGNKQMHASVEVHRRKCISGFAELQKLLLLAAACMRARFQRSYAIAAVAACNSCCCCLHTSAIPSVFYERCSTLHSSTKKQICAKWILGENKKRARGFNRRHAPLRIRAG